MKIVENEFKNYAVAASETDFFKRVKQIKTIPANASDAEIETILGITFNTFERCIEQIKQCFDFFDSLYALGIDTAELPLDRVYGDLVDLLEIEMGDTRRSSLRRTPSSIPRLSSSSLGANTPGFITT